MLNNKYNYIINNTVDKDKYLYKKIFLQSNIQNKENLNNQNLCNLSLHNEQYPNLNKPNKNLIINSNLLVVRLSSSNINTDYKIVKQLGEGIF